MNRFAGETPADRRSLVQAAIEAHRLRESPYVTFEVDPTPMEAEPEGPPPWIQYRNVEEQLNLDCTDRELEPIQSVLDDLGGVHVTAQETVETGGTNLRLTVPGDDERVAHVIERLLLDGFSLPDDVRLWAVEL